MKAWALALALFTASACAAVTFVDDGGMRGRIDRAPARIVSLAPHATELLFVLGAGTRVVAVDSASDYPAAALRLPHVAGWGRVNFEALVTLKPDFVLAWDGLRASDLHRLRALGAPVFVTRIERLDDVPRLLRVLGKLLGADGEAAARAFELGLPAAPHPGPPLVTHPAPRTSPRVLVQLWSHPLISVNGRHWISDMLDRCGAVNVLSDAAPTTPTLSAEAALSLRPDLVLAPADDPDAGTLWLRFPDAGRRVARFDPDLVSRPGPRLAQGTAALCSMLEAR